MLENFWIFLNPINMHLIPAYAELTFDAAEKQKAAKETLALAEACFRLFL